MKKNIRLFLFVLLGLSLANPCSSLAQQTPRQIEPSKNLGLDDSLSDSQQLQNLLKAIDYSLAYLDTPLAATTYAKYPVSGITRDRLYRSLLRFRELLLTSATPAQLQEAVAKEFVFYESVGNDLKGEVLFTAYFEPIYSASLVPTDEYRYPIYGLPADLKKWSQPHPTRAQLEGEDGLLGKKSPLAGNEIAWLKDRFEAYLIQIQGSAKLQLTNGKTMTIGYAGSTRYNYVSIGKELVKDGKFPLEELSLPRVKEYFRLNRQDLDEYLPRNRQMVFFRDTQGAPPTGVLGQPVTGERSIATDKTLMPPGGLALISVPLPYLKEGAQWEKVLTHRYVLDQDAGGAIQGPGRVDIFMGSGAMAGERAGRVRDTGKLYYLLLKN